MRQLEEPVTASDIKDAAEKICHEHGHLARKISIEEFPKHFVWHMATWSFKWRDIMMDLRFEPTSYAPIQAKDWKWISFVEESYPI